MKPLLSVQTVKPMPAMSAQFDELADSTREGQRSPQSLPITITMSISPSIVAAAIPALRLASESIKAAVEAGSDFASHLGIASKADQPQGIAPNTPEKRTSRLDRLLPQLQQFLKSISTDEQSSVELQTDDQGSIQVEGAPVLKHAVAKWLNENPEWTEAWQAAAQEFLAESPSVFPKANFHGQDSRSSSSLRSRISTISAEHSYQTH